MKIILKRPNLSGVALCFVLSFTAVDVAESQQTDTAQCRLAGEFSLRIEYTIDDQYVAKGLRDAGAPVSVRGDERRVVLMRGTSIWERVTGTTWVGDKDSEKVMKEMEDIMSAIDAQGGEGTPEQRLRLFELMNRKRPKIGEARPIDRVRVEVPPPGWSFTYDNVRRLGSKYVQTTALTSDERKLLAGSPEIRGTLERQAQGSDIEIAGERVIEGHTCELTTVTRPARFEYCTAEIRGRQVDLFLRIGQPDNMARVEKAVLIDVGACIEENQFEVPDEVELIDRAGG